MILSIEERADQARHPLDVIREAIRSTCADTERSWRPTSLRSRGDPGSCRGRTRPLRMIQRACELSCDGAGLASRIDHLAPDRGEHPRGSRSSPRCQLYGSLPRLPLPMIALHPDLLSVLVAVEIHATTRFAVLGRVRDISDLGPGPGLGAPGRYLPVSLHPARSPRTSFRSSMSRHAPRLVTALSSANCGRGTWEAGLGRESGRRRWEGRHRQGRSDRPGLDR